MDRDALTADLRELEEDCEKKRPREYGDDSWTAWAADVARRAIAALAVSPEPPLWQHAIRECNEAHAALDKAGARKTTLVLNRNGDGKQEITLGLADRIRSLALSGEGRTPQEQDDDLTRSAEPGVYPTAVHAASSREDS